MSLGMGMGASPFLFSAERLAFKQPGLAPLQGLSFTIGPGLSLLQGGEGRGKTSLLRLIAGELVPSGGQVHRQPGATVCYTRPADAEHDQVPARAWLDQQEQRFAASWQAALAAALIEGFSLAEHMAKPLFMLSTGSRRKLGLVAAAASGAALTLLDTPYAALDARSGRLLSELLREAADGPVRAWVLADYALPAGLSGVPLAGHIDLGD